MARNSWSCFLTPLSAFHQQPDGLVLDLIPRPEILMLE